MRVCGCRNLKMHPGLADAETGMGVAPFALVEVNEIEQSTEAIVPSVAKDMNLRTFRISQWGSRAGYPLPADFLQDAGQQRATP